MLEYDHLGPSLPHAPARHQSRVGRGSARKYLITWPVHTPPCCKVGGNASQEREGCVRADRQPKKSVRADGAAE